MSLENENLGAAVRWPRRMIGVWAAAAALVVAGVFALTRDNRDETVHVGGTAATETDGDGTPSGPAGGPVEQVLRDYFVGGVEAAAANDLAAPFLVYGPGGAEEPGDTWFTALSGYWVDPGLDLECVDRDEDRVTVCLIEAEIPISRFTGRRGQLLLEGRLNSDGQVVSIVPKENSESEALDAYSTWISVNHPEVEACEADFDCFFADDLLDEYAASDGFDPGEPEPLSLP